MFFFFNINFNIEASFHIGYGLIHLGVAVLKNLCALKCFKLQCGLASFLHRTNANYGLNLKSFTTITFQVLRFHSMQVAALLIVN